jgi:hypothetical protein
MEWFLTNYMPLKKKQKFNISRIEKQKIYEKENGYANLYPAG